MVTQKIQTSQNVAGFTLVELIVVITILVILGTIAFLNLGGVSASARDSQRTSDLGQINTQIMVSQAKQGLTYTSMASGTVANAITTPSIAGTGTTAGAYVGGDVNYTVLGVDQNKFQDPTNKVAYKMGATSLAGTSYELAASLEETKTALVMGTFKSRGNTATTDISTATATATTTSITLDPADIGKFKIGDTLAATSDVACPSGKITSVSSDLKTLGFVCPSVGNVTGIKLAQPDIGGLIAQSGSVANAVTNKSTNLPY